MTDGNPIEQPETNEEQETPASQQESAPVEGDQQPDPLTSILSTIKAEDGRQKYGDVESALKSIPHAQETIRQLKARVQELEKQLEQERNMTNVIKEEADSTPAQPAGGEQLNEEKLAQMFDSFLENKRKQEQAEKNKQQFAATLAEQYGDKSTEVLQARAGELGVSPEFLGDLAAKSPQAALKLVVDSSSSQSSGVGAPSINTAAFGSKPAPEKKPVLYGSTTKEILEQFRLHAQG